MAAENVGDVILGYIRLRDAKEALATKQKEEMAVINGKMTLLEAWVTRFLQASGVENVRVDGVGTAYVEKITEVKTNDWEATLEWIKSTGAFEFLEKRVSKAVVKEYLEAHGDVPPGIGISQELVTRIRRQS